ncbi:UDP-N-acetylglucosamine 2-epimerase [Pseudoalteromonas spongiae]|uniref:UDP-N-acetylglucosamine 2-epimerase n=1 Tax=Pseudoalteromonas spongiae TaxID=298657 RepID=A0ABU8EPH0_9GAMM
MKNFAVLTGTRADYGILRPLLSKLENSCEVNLSLYVTGTHLSKAHGYTVEEIQSDSYEKIYLLPIDLGESKAEDLCLASSELMRLFTNQIIMHRPDALILLGDRYEILVVAQVALLLDIPIVHIHGGEVTQGAIDDSIRHAVSKLATIHFPCTDAFANRLRQLGEDDKTIFNVGAMGVENVLTGEKQEIESLFSELSLVLDKPVCLVTYHPVTHPDYRHENNLTALLNVIKRFDDLQFVVTFPNGDKEGIKIIEQWQSIAGLKHVKMIPSLGMQRYTSLLPHTLCVIGNSSSGIIEAPASGVQTINVGSRQDGRPRSDSVIDVPLCEHNIANALIDICSGDFGTKDQTGYIAYSGCDVSEKIYQILISLDWARLAKRPFVDR